MRIKPSRAALVGVAVIAFSSVLIPGNAYAGPTTVTFTLTGAGLAISNPATVSLGSGVSGATLTSPLGAVTVTDARGVLTAAWTATVSSSTFTTGGGTSAETVPKSAVSYASGVATAASAASGVGIFTPGQATALLAAPLTSSQTAYTLTLGVGNNTATWNPTLSIAVPAGAVVGAYTGIVTHSVA